MFGAEHALVTMATVCEENPGTVANGRVYSTGELTSTRLSSLRALKNVLFSFIISNPSFSKFYSILLTWLSLEVTRFDANY